MVIYPNWGMPDGHRIYRGQEGLGVAVPESRADFAARITAFYGGVAERNGWVRAPVTEALQGNISLYIGDNGARFFGGAQPILPETGPPAR